MFTPRAASLSRWPKFCALCQITRVSVARGPQFSGVVKSPQLGRLRARSRLEGRSCASLYSRSCRPAAQAYDGFNIVWGKRGGHLTSAVAQFALTAGVVQLAI